MKIYHIKNSQNKKMKRLPVINYGMHPGGGFVAWPDGSSTQMPAGLRKSNHMRGSLRRGFVAWPEKE